MKVALTGAEGMLGHEIRKVFADADLAALSLRDLDITDLDGAVSVIKEIKPDYLIHAAAYTDVDGSELDPERAYLVNGAGTRNVAMACEEAGCPVIYISSDYVFDGAKNEPYNEWDAPNPVNRYGLSKLMGEKFVSSLTNRFYIVRTSWLYGKNGRNFVDTVIRLLSEKDEMNVVDDQTGSPTSAYDLAVKLKELPGRGYGIYHITNSSYCSWYELACEIALLKSAGTKINPVSSDKISRPARRPAFSALGNTMLRLEGMGQPRHWKDALRDYLKA